MIKKYYAIINWLSEKVISNRLLILQKIEEASNICGIKIEYMDFDSMTVNEIKDKNSWSYIDLQYQNAKKHKNILVFGGDGTKTYILNRLIKDKIYCSFIGVSVGTMNIGVCSVSLDELINVLKAPKTKKVDGIRCRGENFDEYCFIDGVVATTCVATISNKITQISARNLMLGRKEISVPKLIGNSETKIVVIQDGKKLCFPSMGQIMNISVAFISDELKAKVLAGGVETAACSGYKWGIIASDFPLTWADATQDDIFAHSPIQSVFCPLKEDATVIVENLNNKAFLINDGNAVINTSKIKFSYEKNIYSLKT